MDVEVENKMEIAAWSIKIYEFYGLWRSKSDSRVTKLFHNFTFFTFMVVYAGLLIGKFINLMSIERMTLGEFCKQIFLYPEAIGVLILKALHVYVNQSKITRMLSMFEKDLCRPKDETELKLREKYQKEYQ